MYVAEVIGIVKHGNSGLAIEKKPGGVDQVIAIVGLRQSKHRDRRGSGWCGCRSSGSGNRNYDSGCLEELNVSIGVAVDDKVRAGGSVVSHVVTTVTRDPFLGDTIIATDKWSGLNKCDAFDFIFGCWWRRCELLTTVRIYGCLKLTSRL